MTPDLVPPTANPYGLGFISPPQFRADPQAPIAWPERPTEAPQPTTGHGSGARPAPQRTATITDVIEDLQFQIKTQRIVLQRVAGLDNAQLIAHEEEARHRLLHPYPDAITKDDLPQIIHQVQQETAATVLNHLLNLGLLNLPAEQPPTDPDNPGDEEELEEGDETTPWPDQAAPPSPPDSELDFPQDAPQAPIPFKPPHNTPKRKKRIYGADIDG